ncbi:plancitoxin-1 isoform X1 [Hydra vulgaris]|nr:plancitoxin-1 [Hydra vulgaris]
MWQIFSFLYFFLTTASGKLTCINDNGDSVDMFILYKLPRIKTYHVPDLVHSGLGYGYLDSQTMKFALSSFSIGDQNSAAGRTLNQVYSKFKNNDNTVEDIAHIFYNDENPNGEPFYKDCGHTKGAVAFDQETGFWMITSVPKYPYAAAEGYSYPSTGCMYGQMFLCVTFNTSMFDTIGLQLRFNDPHIHDSNFPSSWESLFPNVNKALKGDMIKESPFTNLVELTSLAGVKFLSFAKSGGFDHDLYRDFVAPSLKSNILTETWQHGAVLNSSCNIKYTVEDIIKLNVQLGDLDFPFPNFDDHSKYVVGKTEDSPYVCVGDINRAPTQFVRGGGTLCLKDVTIWKVFRSFVVEDEECS